VLEISSMTDFMLAYFLADLITTGISPRFTGAYYFESLFQNAIDYRSPSWLECQNIDIGLSGRIFRGNSPGEHHRVNFTGLL
jgi:hypothetical protein